MILKDVAEVADQYSGNARKVLEYSLVMTRLVAAAKQPGFTETDWAPLAALIDTGRFVRVGNFKEVMDWPQYAAFLTRWASDPQTSWECSFKRISEVGNLVFLELEERSRHGEHLSVVNSLTVYAFDAAGMVQHLDVYLQMESIPDGVMAAYE